MRITLIVLWTVWTTTAWAAEKPEAALAAQARTLLQRYCQNCHHGEGSEGGELDFLKHAQLLAKRGEDKPLVVAGKPNESYLFERIEKNQMPPKNISVRLSPEQVAVVRKWIEIGAPDFPRPTERKRVPLEAVLTTVRDYLRSAPRENRPYLRFFSLTHLFNNPAIPDTDFPVYRAALSKAINSVSRKTRIVRPTAIDKPNDAVFVIDVRELDWDRNDLWQEIIKVYPYGLKYGSHPNTELKKLDDDVGELTHCELPIVRADWFVATATRPPLYYTLLQIPGNSAELEKELGVDVEANFREEKLARGGFTRSGVSGQNRLVERHEATSGYYWKSYDFKESNGRGKLVRFPLGPLNLFPPGRHPYPKQAFVHDGGEMIWSLPNGMQAYFLTEGKGNRIDEGPIQVVSDSLKTSGTPAIVDGVSCMACHKHGTIGFVDHIRDHSAVFGDGERKLKALYPDAKTMKGLLEDDERRFLDALEKCVGPFFRIDEETKKKPLKEFVEPVAEVARLYRLGYLDKQTIALELELESPEALLNIGSRKLKQLGLENLLKDGVLSRTEWEAVDGYSLMQEVAQQFGATPFGK